MGPLEAFLGSKAFDQQLAEAKNEIRNEKPTPKVVTEADISSLLIGLMETRLESRRQASSTFEQLAAKGTVLKVVTPNNPFFSN